MACSTYGERRVVYRVWWGILKVRDHLKDPGVDRRFILKCEIWTGSSWLRIGTGGVHL